MESNEHNHKIDNINIQGFEELITPKELKKAMPVNAHIADKIHHFRKQLVDILNKKDERFIVITGPCSIHDYALAIDYAERLQPLIKRYQDKLFIMMRVYFEKPRTTVGWKGYVNDPHLDGTFDMDYGLRKARSLLMDLNAMNIPCATEALDPVTPQYLGDLFSWAAIGARTSESQTHREMASGLSMPIGFKNGTDGHLSMAINGILACSKPQTFLGINADGQVGVLKTKGNPHGHIILRGGIKPNYDKESVADVIKELEKNKIEPKLIIDCSHGNSQKNHKNQPEVALSVIRQRAKGNRAILGLMLESNICAGNQSDKTPKQDLQYGVSITDACIDIETTEELLRDIYRILDKE